MNTTADHTADNIRLRRELKAAETLSADYLKNAERAAARAADENQMLRNALYAAERHQHDNAHLRGENTQLRADADRWCNEAMKHAATIDRMMSAMEKFGEHGLIVHVRAIVDEARP